MINLRRLTALADTFGTPAADPTSDTRAAEEFLEHALGSARRRLPLAVRWRLADPPALAVVAPAVALRRFVQLTHTPMPAESRLAASLAAPDAANADTLVAACARVAALVPAAHRDLALVTPAAEALRHALALLCGASLTDTCHAAPPAGTPRSRPGGWARRDPADPADPAAPDGADDLPTLAAAAWLLTPALTLPAPPELERPLRRLANTLAHAAAAEGIEFDPDLAEIAQEFQTTLRALDAAPRTAVAA